MLTVFWVRRYVRSDAATSDLPDLNERGQQYIGRSLVVEQAIQNGRGKVRVGDSRVAGRGPRCAGRRAREGHRRPGAPCWWWSVQRPDGDPGAFAWLVALDQPGSAVDRHRSRLVGGWQLSRGEPAGWWWLGAGVALLIADVADRFRLGAPRRSRNSDQPDLNRRGGPARRPRARRRGSDRGRPRQGARRRHAVAGEGPDAPAGAEVR